MSKFEWVIEEEAGTRIDKVIVTRTGESRTTIQDWINENHVTVNDANVKSNYKVQDGDRVTVIPKEKEQLEAVPEDIPLDIRYEDEHVLVINKPRGMVVHPAPGHPSGTVVNALLGLKMQLSTLNEEMRPGIVHRIDKDTSGLLIVAKTDQAHQHLVQQLQGRTLKRTYETIVHGVIAHEFGTIDAPIGRHHHDRQKMTVTDVHSREAITHFTVIKRYKNYTRVECQLETGRTHQIRVHMEYIDHPIAGDPKYGPKKTLPIEGQALHAKELSFIHPATEETVTVTAELPDDMEQLIYNLEHSSEH
ncbi:RluA family pseudouridine synthase [Geomicrobium sp. JCM 19055]|uniref:RluA family pseudouridine synthase n=1 Tax=Geomicrobium sp. JCM 19055 TaxID=1460649 RepID=UPI00045EDDA7|nr:RluA family pseudouridine synthase [Geomicrobium sp. JCM 19055]GAK00231.1 ribosomal large subunit pseudouridine synthase D [Geomicrobium sp. JCM 19055]